MGARVLIAAEYRTFMILPPMIIFTGVYGAKLMQQWESFEDAKVVFNESHWMTSQTSIIYLNFLARLFPGEKIGLIWDKHSSHYSDEVLQFIKESSSKNKTKIVPVLVDEGLTPIIQVPDVAINKIFKQTLKDQYYKHRLELEITIGTKLRVTREKMVEFIVNAINDINDVSTKTLMVQDAFKYCGLNPWSTASSLEAFTEHLDNLEKNNVLKCMILSNQQAVKLD